MAKHITKVKGSSQLRDNDIDSSKIKDSTIINADMALGTITGDVFLDYSIQAIKLSNDVTKLGNLYNEPNGPVRMGLDGKLPALDGSKLTNLPGVPESMASSDLSDIEGAVNTANGVVKLDAVGKLPALDGSGLTNISPSNLSYPFSTAGGEFVVGTSDAFGRKQMHFVGTSAMLRLGSSAIDGDPGDIDAEGFVAYKPSVNRQITLQPEDMRLTESDWSKYIFVSNSDITAVGNAAHDGDLLSAVPSTATVTVNGSFKYVDGNQEIGKVLTSGADGSATWQTATGLPAGGVPGDVLMIDGNGNPAWISILGMEIDGNIPVPVIDGNIPVPVIDGN